jgi:steroid delta-isomerase-like uncharacterized protein
MSTAEETGKVTALTVVRGYFDALARRDPDAMARFWAPDGVEHIAGMFDGTGPDEVRDFFAGLFSAMPDFRLVVDHTVTQRDRVAVHWHATGTFTGTDFLGIEATGGRVRLEGVDLLRVADGLIVRNDAYADGMGFARQLGLIPEAGSKQEARLYGLFNRRTRLMAKMTAPAEQVAEDVWVVRGGFPTKGMNVYLVRDGDGVLCFDAGISTMAGGIAREAAKLGGLTRVVLGHAHADHRGAAPALGVPVWCSVDEVAAAEGTGRFEEFDLDKLPFGAKQAYRAMLAHWDGGPVHVDGTLREGDEVGDGFKVVAIPGHSAGMIALFRERDRLALTSDAFYTVDPVTLRKGGPRLPHAAFTPDMETARASLRKLADLEPAAAWPGHAEAVTGDVRGQLLAAAAA